MCGIAGFVGEGDRELLKRMCDAMKHRGPDDEGYWLDEGVGLGHRRLSIIDLAGGHQPMCNEDESAWIVFNGEIYNYQELRKRLEASGHCFRTESDTEAIIHAYEEYGSDCPKHLRGMFAFAIWNNDTRELFCARDRLGIKPFFYAQIGDSFVFGSEIKALLEHPRVRPPLNLSAFHEYMSFGFVPGPQTIFEGINSLQPGTRLFHRHGTTETDEYWRVNGIERPPASFADAKERLLSLLAESVGIRLVADVPVGAYLSGGLDSSLLVALMCQIGDGDVNTLSVSFSDESYDEAPFSEMVAKELGTNHRVLRSDPSSLERLPTVAYHLEQPMNDAATIPTYELARLTKEHVTVVLTGEGADECFSGYRYMRYLRYLLDPLWQRSVRWLAKLLRPAAAASRRRWRSVELMADCQSPVQMMNAIFGRFSLGEKRLLYGPAMLDILDEVEHSHISLISERLGSGPPYQQVVSFYLRTYLADDLLVKTDRMTMAHGVEARVPYLDHKVVEFAVSLPANWKVRAWTDKYILRQIGRDYLPRAIWSKPKHGFGVPLERWLRKEHGSDRREVRSRLAANGIINEVTWSEWLDNDHLPGRDETQRRTLFFLEEWARVFADKIKW